MKSFTVRVKALSAPGTLGEPLGFFLARQPFDSPHSFELKCYMRREATLFGLRGAFDRAGTL
jgi:hypothetical protein